MLDEDFYKLWTHMADVLYSNYKTILAASVTFAAGTLAAVITSSILPAIAAISGAMAGIITAYTTHKASSLTAQNNLMSQYIGFIQSLQQEVTRLRTENTEYRLRLEMLEKELIELKGRAVLTPQQ